MDATSEDAFDSLMQSADPAMVVVTTVAEGERAGCLVGFHGQASIAPGHYCVWLSKANHTYRVALRATHLAVHFLAESDLATAEHFGTQTGESVDKLAGVEVETHAHGVPLLAACPRRLVLERIALLDVGGDHVCLTGRVVEAHADGEFAPLRVSDAVHLEPGHDADERAVSP